MKKEEISDEIALQKENLVDIVNDLYNLIINAEKDIINTKSINDLDKFIRKLKEENLYTRELEDFIENYIKYDNGDEE